MLRSQLQHLLSSPQFRTLELLRDRLIARYKEGTRKGTSEFETLWNLAFYEGAVHGLNELFTEAFNEAGKLDET